MRTAVGIMLATMSLGLFVNCPGSKVSFENTQSSRAIANNGTGYNGKLHYTFEGSCPEGEARLEVSLNRLYYPTGATLVRENCQDIAPVVLDLDRDLGPTPDLKSIEFRGQTFWRDAASDFEIEASGLIRTCAQLDPRPGFARMDFAESAGDILRALVRTNQGEVLDTKMIAAVRRGNRLVYENNPADPGHYFFVENPGAVTPYNLRLNFAAGAGGTTEIQLDGQARCNLLGP